MTHEEFMRAQAQLNLAKTFTEDFDEQTYDLTPNCHDWMDIRIAVESATKALTVALHLLGNNKKELVNYG